MYFNYSFYKVFTNSCENSFYTAFIQKSIEFEVFLRDFSRGALPIMAYKGRLRPKGVPISAFRYMKG